MTGLVIESIGSDSLIWPWLPAALARRNMKRRLALAEWLILTGALRALWRRDGLEQDEDEDDVFRRKLISEARMGPGSVKIFEGNVWNLPLCWSLAGKSDHFTKDFAAPECPMVDSKSPKVPALLAFDASRYLESPIIDLKRLTKFGVFSRQCLTGHP